MNGRPTRAQARINDEVALQVYNLHVIDGIEISTIAVALGLSRSQAWRRLYKHEATLRKQSKREALQEQEQELERDAFRERFNRRVTG